LTILSPYYKVILSQLKQEVPMAHVCPNCHKVFEQSGKYCSKRCSREVRRQRWRFFMASVVGVLVLVFAIYTAPRSDFRPEPRHPLSASEIQRLAKDDSCPICVGKSKVDCKICIDGKIFYMGTSAECNRCGGKGWIICLICKGTGKLLDALANATS
jgi:predicted nucleic acid-binding Zn ribbon protein